MSKKRLLVACWAIVAMVWIAMGVGLALGMDGGLRIALVTAAAIALEAGFWITAAILGVSVFESRRAIWRYITGKSGDQSGE